MRKQAVEITNFSKHKLKWRLSIQFSHVILDLFYGYTRLICSKKNDESRIQNNVWICIGLLRFWFPIQSFVMCAVIGAFFSARVLIDCCSGLVLGTEISKLKNIEKYLLNPSYKRVPLETLLENFPWLLIDNQIENSEERIRLPTAICWS